MGHTQTLFKVFKMSESLKTETRASCHLHRSVGNRRAALPLCHRPEWSHRTSPSVATSCSAMMREKQEVGSQGSSRGPEHLKMHGSPRHADVTTQAASGATVESLASAIGYAPFGGPSAWQFANGQAVTITRDKDYRIAGIVSSGSSTALDLAPHYALADDLGSVEALKLNVLVAAGKPYISAGVEALECVTGTGNVCPPDLAARSYRALQPAGSSPPSWFVRVRAELRSASCSAGRPARLRALPMPVATSAWLGRPGAFHTGAASTVTPAM